MKIVINVKHGGFGLSEKAVLRYAELKGITLHVLDRRSFTGPTYSLVPEAERIDMGEFLKLKPEERVASNAAYRDQTFSPRSIPRTDPVLVQVVEELGAEADGDFAELQAVEIPDDVNWQIEEYDGLEHVAECHRTWG